jgi:hypothetical protein
LNTRPSSGEALVPAVAVGLLAPRRTSDPVFRFCGGVRRVSACLTVQEPQQLAAVQKTPQARQYHARPDPDRDSALLHNKLWPTCPASQVNMLGSVQ